MRTDIAVIGGGAAGFAAAISAKTAAPWLDVTIVERMDKTGRKLLATGNGRCNLGNTDIDRQFYHGSVDAVNIIEKTPSAPEFFAEMGVICTADSEGRLYPRSSSAATVLGALRLRASALGINEVCGFEVADISGKSGNFALRSADSEITAKRVIICAGGYAAPQYGTDGKMLAMLRKKGYKTAKISPADAPLRVAPEAVKGLKGVRVKGTVSAVSSGKVLAKQTGEIQFTENSVSGICVFNLSWLFSSYEGRLGLVLDLLPDMSTQDVLAYLRAVKKMRSECAAEELLTGVFTKNLALYLVKRVLGKSLAEPISGVTNDELQCLAAAIKALDFTVTGCSSWQNAQVTSGGIHADCITQSLESKTEKGIYFAGEILDVDGICGGFNLQWAWSSGIVSGRSCALSLNGDRK